MTELRHLSDEDLVDDLIEGATDLARARSKQRADQLRGELNDLHAECVRRLKGRSEAARLLRNVLVPATIKPTIDDALKALGE